MNNPNNKSTHPLPHGLPRTPSHPHLSSTSWSSFKTSPTSLLSPKTSTPSSAITPLSGVTVHNKPLTGQLGIGGSGVPTTGVSKTTPHCQGVGRSPPTVASAAPALERKLSVIESAPRGRFAQSYGSVERITVGRSTSFSARASFRRQVFGRSTSLSVRASARRQVFVSMKGAAVTTYNDTY